MISRSVHLVIDCDLLKFAFREGLGWVFAVSDSSYQFHAQHTLGHAMKYLAVLDQIKDAAPDNIFEK